MPNQRAAEARERLCSQVVRVVEPGGFEPPTSCLQNPAGVLQQGC